MATIATYRPTTAITRAMFNFDAVGASNYVYTGPIRVSVSDSFTVDDQASLRFYGDIYTNGAAEVNWATETETETETLTHISETLNIIQQFANVDFRWQGNIDTIDADSVVNPADVATANLSDINISLIRRGDIEWVGLAGGDTDAELEYTGATGDVFINESFLAEKTFDVGTPSRTTLMHELLHSLGLSHPHSDFTDDIPIITADYAATRNLGFAKLGFRTVVPKDMYKEYFSIMSYADDSPLDEPHTPMILDVIALQQAYGEGTGTHTAGNDTIGAGTSGYRVYFDKGGIDTIDLGLFTTGAYLHMGTTITGAAHLVGVAMSSADALRLDDLDGGPQNLRWFYGEYENALGSAGADRLIGNSLANHISGLVGADKIYGANGNDLLDGGAGADLLSGGAGDDRLRGGTGADTADYATASRAVVVNLTVSTSQTTGGAGRDTLSSIENLNGSIHADRLTGSSGGNTLSGGKGNDVLNGAAGADALTGGAGNDRLIGGAGKDSFLFDKYSFSGRDQVLDFRAVDDTITLENALFSKLRVPGALAADNYRENSQGIALDANDFILFNTHSGALFYDADGNGAGHAVQFATLYSGHGLALSASQLAPLDFLIV